jgi:hypothetical protein
VGKKLGCQCRSEKAVPSSLHVPCTTVVLAAVKTDVDAAADLIPGRKEGRKERSKGKKKDD